MERVARRLFDEVGGRLGRRCVVMRVCGVFGGTLACCVSGGVKDWACWIVARTSRVRFIRMNLDVQGRIRVH